jgi:hypothetical protein
VTTKLTVLDDGEGPEVVSKLMEGLKTRRPSNA